MMSDYEVTLVNDSSEYHLLFCLLPQHRDGLC